jgi:uncharacterized protein DUF998
VVFGVAAIAGLTVATALLARLHLVPTGIDPIEGAVSDYGTTRFHAYYRAMVVALGATACLLAVGLARETDAHALAWLWVYGGSRIAIAGFMVDRDPPLTTGGRVHLVLAAAAFTAIALASTSISWDGDPAVLRPLGQAVAASAIATAVTRLAPPLRRVFGLVERVLYATSIAWLAIAAADIIG